jgi:hypothetical protein
VSEKVEQLIDLAEESANKWQDDTSEVVFEKSCYQKTGILCLITENGTLTYKRRGFDDKNQNPKWSFTNAQQMFTALGSIGGSAWLKVEQAEIINVPEATEEYLITELETNCFNTLYSLKRVRLPDTITKIGDKVFSYCISLKEVNLPDTISSFGAGCFSFCYSLEEFDIPPLVTSLPSNMFQQAYKLTKVNGTERLTSIGSYCFDSCHTLGEIAFGENLNTVGSSALNLCVALKKVQFKSNSITFGERVFYNCGRLENVSFVAESIQNSVSFAQSSLLSAESIQSIIDGLATVETAQTLTLSKQITLTDEQKATINAKGWTLAQ